MEMRHEERYTCGSENAGRDAVNIPRPYCLNGGEQRMVKCSSPSSRGKGRVNGEPPDHVSKEIIGVIEGVSLSAEMSREFSPAVVDHVFEVVLPQAIEKGEKDVVEAAEKVLAKHNLAKPNHVSGLWEPLSVPRNELQVRELYASRLPDYGYRLVASHSDFPDWLVVDGEGKFLYVEVEHRSSGFQAHGHDPAGCDLIMCWEHDWRECPVPVLEFFGGETHEPRDPVPDSRKKANSRVRVNFSASLSRHHVGFSSAEHSERTLFAMERFEYLTESQGYQPNEAAKEVARELGITTQAVRSRLKLVGRDTRRLGKSKASKVKQVQSRADSLIAGGMKRSEATKILSAELGLSISTVASYLSPSRRKT
jgi:hypothetical protein